MSWQKYLLIPRLAMTGRKAPPADVAWEAYWSGVQRTGPDGDVLWDGAGEGELRWWREAAAQHLDPALPVLDLGCGNGRLTRLLAEDFPAALGVDLSPAAVDRARRESAGHPKATFVQLDVAAPDAADRVLAEVGPAQAVVRGVLHILDAEQRRRAAASLARVVPAGGALVALEPNHRGGSLAYLEFLGARRGRLPYPLARLIDLGVPRPVPIGPQEMAAAFPAADWAVVTSGPVGLTPTSAMGMPPGLDIPGWSTVLRRSGVAAGTAPAA